MTHWFPVSEAVTMPRTTWLQMASLSTSHVRLSNVARTLILFATIYKRWKDGATDITETPKALERQLPRLYVWVSQEVCNLQFLPPIWQRGKKVVNFVWNLCDIVLSQQPSDKTVWKYYLTFTLTLRRLMSYIYGAPILDVSRSHTTTPHSR